MRWSASHAVWITEIDDEHKEIFERVADLQKALAGADARRRMREATERLTDSIAGHFAHEERLMRAARYGSLAWHKREHDAAVRRVRRFAAEIAKGDTGAGGEMVEYLIGWLHNHARLADRMMGAFLRNQQLSVGKVTFRAGTKAPDACAWVDAKGDKFDASAAEPENAF